MAGFDTLDAMGDAVGAVYAECTDRILVNLARHFKYLKPGEQPGGAFQYQARKLAEFGQVRRESMQIIRDMLGSVDKELADSLEQAILDALEGIEAPLRQAAEAGLLNGGAVPPVVSPRLTEAFRLYYEQSADKLNLVNTVMLESTEEAYRATVSDITARMQRQQEILNTATGQVVTGVESFNQALRLATEKMVENGITGFVDHGGHRWRPEVYVAMDMRTTFHNVSRRAFWDRNREYANDLYLVSQHPGARPLCYPWQCRVISRTGPHSWTTDGAGNPVQVWAQDETTYGEPAGLFGINCGHHPLLFVPGVSMIPELRQDEEETAETYALSQRQRGLERDFRKARLDMAVAKAQGDEEGLKAAREKLRRADDRLNSFEEETGRRRRREREYAPVNAKWPENTPKPSSSDQKPTKSAQKAKQSAQNPVKSDQQTPENAQDVAEMKESVTEEQAPVEKLLTDEAKDDTLSSETKAAGDGVREIATIQLDKISARWGDGIDKAVVLSDERIGHIMERHPGAYEQYGQYVSQTIEQPDYILEDMKNANTAAFIRHVEDTNLNVIIKLAIQDNEAKMKSSVITLYPMSDKRLRRLINKSKVVYKSAIT